MSSDVCDLTVIGAGPAGLAATFWAGMRQATVRLVDALPAIGGQLVALYPEKPIYDVVGHERILAHELVDRLARQALEPFDVDVHLETTAHSIAWSPDAITLQTDAGALRSRALIVAGGHGAVELRRLPEGDADLTPWEGRGVHYVLREKAALTGRRVIVVGGGDSALDWALDLLDVAAHVTLVHRRTRFRALERTVQAVREAAAAGRLELRTDTVLAGAEGDDGLEAVRLAPRDGGASERVDADDVLLQLGHVTRLGPLAEWGFELDGASIVVDGLGHTGLDRVWACGDAVSGPGRLQLITTGFGEAAVVVAQAVAAIRPGETLQPAYSTDTGVPPRPT